MDRYIAVGGATRCCRGTDILLRRAMSVSVASLRQLRCPYNHPNPIANPKTSPNSTLKTNYINLTLALTLTVKLEKLEAVSR